MQSGKNRNILYFYLKHKVSFIKLKEENNSLTQGESSRSRFSMVLEKIGIAALTTLVVFETVIYMNVGKVKLFFSIYELQELFFAFVFLLTLFGTHSLISVWMKHRFFMEINRFLKLFIEMLIVISSTLLIYMVTNYLPLVLIFGEEGLLPVRVRTAFISGTFISLFFYYFVERERHKNQLQAEMLRSARLQKENYQAQLEGLKNQVQPHFLFNSLNVLRSLIHKDPGKATEFTQRLSDLYRSFLAYGDEPLISLEKELEVSKAYIFLLETRFGKALQISLDIPEDSLSYFLPPGALQTLIENAIKHNGSTSKNPLQVRIYIEEGKLVVRNRLRPRLEKTTSTKTGLKNLKTRYRFLSQEEVEWVRTEEEFIARLPLLKVENYENSNS
ncbi:sensor histidine kinase [Zobellia galactanivorans]|uniref:Two-component system-Sensor histidine kinase n=1 Tax=Zobellia galactanivorans (strain DSM 12802 / CCUG 47099 / CIP 106680 / NCIMB 13871 / Dsij) TaxID=63186 RepID=G0L7F5_ZOBGA|nr:histidine kinase [Zobellia galactanivorans]CAZ97383.1 Two-component system-Sensor histidine kinase [Zobellia galactanivorans]